MVFLAEFSFQDHVGTFTVYRLIRHMYLGVLQGRLVGMPPQITLFRGHLAEKRGRQLKIVFSNSVFEKRRMPFMGTGPVVSVWIFFSSWEKAQGGHGQLEVPGQGAVKMKMTASRHDKESMAMFRKVGPATPSASAGWDAQQRQDRILAGAHQTGAAGQEGQAPVTPEYHEHICKACEMNGGQDKKWKCNARKCAAMDFLQCKACGAKWDREHAQTIIKLGAGKPSGFSPGRKAPF